MEQELDAAFMLLSRYPSYMNWLIEWDKYQQRSLEAFKIIKHLWRVELHQFRVALVKAFIKLKEDLLKLRQYDHLVILNWPSRKYVGDTTRPSYGGNFLLLKEYDDRGIQLLRTKVTKSRFVWDHILLINFNLTELNQEIRRDRRWLIEDRWENIRKFMYMTYKAPQDIPFCWNLQQLSESSPSLIKVIARFLYF